MKKQFLTLTFLLLGITVSAQVKQRTLGILLSPNLEVNNPENGFIDRQISHTLGLFYDHQLTRRFGVSTGLFLDTERFVYDYSRVWIISELPERAKGKINAIEVPVNLTFCLNPDNESGFKTFLFSGIMLHRDFFSKRTLYYPYKVETYRGEGYTHNLWADSFMNLGFELRKRVGRHYTGAIGFGAKFKPAHSLAFSSPSRDPFILNLNLKFGRNL